MRSRRRRPFATRRRLERSRALTQPSRSSSRAQVVYDLYAPDGAAVAVVAEMFGDGVLDAATGAIDRAKLGAIVIGDDAKMRALESAVHPLVERAREAFVEAHANDDVVVFDIPLLYEKGYEASVDAVCVVSTGDEATQRARVLKRDGMTEEKFNGIAARQIPDAEKRATRAWCRNPHPNPTRQRVPIDPGRSERNATPYRARCRCEHDGLWGSPALAFLRAMQHSLPRTPLVGRRAPRSGQKGRESRPGLLSTSNSNLGLRGLTLTSAASPARQLVLEGALNALEGGWKVNGSPSL